MPNLPKLGIIPDASGYRVDYGNTVVVTPLVGGPPRIRADYDDTVAIINLQWTIQSADFDALMAFYRTATDKGANPFLMDLILDSSSLTEYTVQFVEKTFKLTQQFGLTFVVNASVYVSPLPPDSINDQLLYSGIG